MIIDYTRTNRSVETKQNGNCLQSVQISESRLSEFEPVDTEALLLKTNIIFLEMPKNETRLLSKRNTSSSKWFLGLGILYNSVC